jgi:hypothetical protein
MGDKCEKHCEWVTRQGRIQACRDRQQDAAVCVGCCQHLESSPWHIFFPWRHQKQKQITSVDTIGEIPHNVILLTVKSNTNKLNKIIEIAFPGDA